MAGQRAPAGRQRRLLGVAALGMLLTGFVLALIPFRGYLGTDQVRVERERVEIPLAALPVERVREIAWRDGRLFVGSGPVPVVIAVAYRGGAYLLPDDAAADGTVPCALFGAVGDRFLCMDPAVAGEWRARASWSLDGEPLAEGFPALRSIAYRIEGDALVITAMEEAP